MENMTIEQLNAELERLAGLIRATGTEITRYIEKGKYDDAASAADSPQTLAAMHKKTAKALKAAEKAEKEAKKQAEKEAKTAFVKGIKGTEVLDQYLQETYEKDLAWWESLQEADRTTLGKTERSFAVMGRKDAEKVFQQDLEARRYNLLKKVSDKVGNIEELDLKRNENYGLDGWIKGDKGTAFLQTIGAGGYNIQRFHFRTLVN